MKEFILKNKFLFILSICFFCLFVFTSNVFASYTFNNNDEQISLADLPFNTVEHPDYVLGWIGTSNQYAVGYPRDEYDKFWQNHGEASENSVSYYKVGTNQWGEWVWFTYDMNKGEWSSQKITSHGHLTFYGSSSKIIVSTKDIYKNADSDEIFFQKAPVTTAMSLEEVKQVPETMVKVLRILIPVGLIVFGIGLVIYLIKFLYYRVS